MNLFSGGYLPLEQRSLAENLYWAICLKLQKLVKTMDEVPEDLQNLDESLSDTYFCNFSLFQSIPDSWAIKQLFPIMPIHRLNERPTRHAVLGDITCDSDGKVDQFIDRRDVKRTLPLHTFNGSPYYLGVFLVGAYQEILGDLHNLLGDTHAVHVSLGRRRRGRARCRDQGRHGSRGAGLRRIRRRSARVQSCASTSKRRCAAAASTTRSPGGCCASTKRASNGYTYLEETPAIGWPRTRCQCDKIVVFTDGASKGNPGPGGWGAIVATPEGHVTELGGGAAITTNNKMELTGAIQALTRLLGTSGPVAIYTDSTYVIKGIREWVPNWRRRGWKTATGSEVMNRELWEELHSLTTRPRAARPSGGTTCAGTSALRETSAATRLPMHSRRSDQSSCTTGHFPVIRLRLAICRTTPAFLRASLPRLARRRVCRYSYLSVVDGKPMRHATWAECEQRVKGRSGALFKKATSEADQADILRSWRFKPEDVS